MTFQRQTWIADALRNAGLTVVEVDGWRTRGHERFLPRGVVDHHTASAPNANTPVPSLRLVRDGREGLSGPLYNVLVGRDLTVHVVAAGRANHAGSGGWRGLAGNLSTFGVAAEHRGTAAEAWDPEQREVVARVEAALLAHIGTAADMLCGHKEWTTRKIDPYAIDMDAHRAAVTAILTDRSATKDAARSIGKQPAARTYITVGDAGERVEQWQQLLTRLLPDHPDAHAPDGQFGPMTARWTVAAYETLGLTTNTPDRPRVGARSVAAAQAAAEAAPAAPPRAASPAPQPQPAAPQPAADAAEAATPASAAGGWAQEIVDQMRTLALRNVGSASSTWLGSRQRPDQRVRTLQGLLTARGIVTRVDGVGGPQTRRHVAQFQQRTGTGRANGSADFIVGRNTWGALNGVSR